MRRLGAVLAAALASSACVGERRPAPVMVKAAAPPTVREVREVRAVSPPERTLADELRERESLRKFVEKADVYRLQVLVAVPSGGTLRRRGFRVDAEYFYPASAIKLCSAVAVLAKLTALREQGGIAELDARAEAFSPTKGQWRGPTVAQAIDSSLIFSDNDGTNLLFDILGADEIHKQLWDLGLSSVRIRQHFGGVDRIDPRTHEPAETTSPPIVLRVRGRPVYSVPQRRSSLDLPNDKDVPGLLVGETHVSGGRVIDQPMSFEGKNRISLADLQDLLVKVTRPDLAPGPSPRLGDREKRVLSGALSANLVARGIQRSDLKRAESVHKPFLAGIERVVPRESIRIYNKAGQAYGFVVDNAYVVDERTGRSFYLTAVMHTNANGRMGDDAYDYEHVTTPAFADLAEIVARSELLSPQR
jgi:beta-lactamase class A